MDRTVGHASVESKDPSVRQRCDDFARAIATDAAIDARRILLGRAATAGAEGDDGALVNAASLKLAAAVVDLRLAAL